MSKHHIGRCGNCGGAVTVPVHWMGVNPPTPTCDQCGSVAETRGPTVAMKPRRAPKPTDVDFYLGRPTQ